MRIAQVAPLYESVPPRGYGGTERIVSYLTEALVDAGHEVTLFASGDSKTDANLVSVCPRSLRTDPGCNDSLAHHIVLLNQVLQRRRDFDVIHFHIDYIHYPVSEAYGLTHLTTLHGRLDIPDLVPLYHTYPGVPVNSISDSQRLPLPFLNWRKTIYHGLPIDLYRPNVSPTREYLAFLGRISPEKGIERAIDISERSGIPLKIAAKVDRVDREYFESKIEPRIRNNPRIEFLSEIGDAQKGPFLQNALALLFPIDWPEPFGLVMIEAMACGTPTLAFHRGSVPEVIEDGITGRIVSNVEGALEALRTLNDFDRKRCRREFEERFTSMRMARDYVEVYEELLGHRRVRKSSPKVHATDHLPVSLERVVLQ